MILPISASQIAINHNSPPPHRLKVSLFRFFLPIQGLVLARQALYHFIYSTSKILKTVW
jgi:hypothetical protein